MHDRHCRPLTPEGQVLNPSGLAHSPAVAVQSGGSQLRQPAHHHTVLGGHLGQKHAQAWNQATAVTPRCLCCSCMSSLLEATSKGTPAPEVAAVTYSYAQLGTSHFALAFRRASMSSMSSSAFLLAAASAAAASAAALAASAAAFSLAAWASLAARAACCSASLRSSGLQAQQPVDPASYRAHADQGATRRLTSLEA